MDFRCQCVYALKVNKAKLMSGVANRRWAKVKHHKTLMLQILELRFPFCSLGCILWLVSKKNTKTI